MNHVMTRSRLFITLFLALALAACAEVTPGPGEPNPGEPGDFDVLFDTPPEDVTPGVETTFSGLVDGAEGLEDTVLSFSADDEGVTLPADGEVTVSPEGDFSVPVTFPADGNYVITANATLAGEQAEGPVSVTVGDTPGEPGEPIPGDPVTLPLRLNAGGEAVEVTVGGETLEFVADDEYVSSDSEVFDYEGPVTAPTGFEGAEQVFLTERASSANDAGFELTYTIAVAEGTTTADVNLHFAENFFTGDEAAPPRLFDITVQDDIIEQSYNILEAAGGPLQGVVVEVPDVNVEDGTLTITFTNVTNRGKVNAIEVLPADIAVDPTP